MSPLRQANAQLVAAHIGRQGGSCSFSSVVDSDLKFWSRLSSSMIRQAINDAAELGLVDIVVEPGFMGPALMVYRHAAARVGGAA